MANRKGRSVANGEQTLIEEIAPKLRGACSVSVPSIR